MTSKSSNTSFSSNQRPWPFAVVGLILSMYALYVEHKVAHKPPEEEFVSLCDIEQIGASCSSVFQLPEGKMLSFFGIIPEGHILDVPNAALGVIYYTLWLLVLFSMPKEVLFLIASLAMASSVFLATKLTIMKELCILCWTTHVINSRLWWNAYSIFTAAGSNTMSSTGGGGAANGDGGNAKVKRV